MSNPYKLFRCSRCYWLTADGPMPVKDGTIAGWCWRYPQWKQVQDDHHCGEFTGRAVKKRLFP